MPRPQPTYGTPNWEMIGRWLELEPDDDGPFWALNLMKYKAQADYGEGASHGRTGKEADDAYTPVGPLAAIGAMIAFAGDVIDQPLGEPRWDRIGIVRYPSRRAFFEMQQRDDFKSQHVHKEAGMDVTIVMACLPLGVPADVADDGGALVLLVERTAEPVVWRSHPGVTPVAEMTVEGVIVGDERSFDRAAFVRADETALSALAGPDAGAEELHAVVIAPLIDQLVPSIRTAGTAPAGGEE